MAFEMKNWLQRLRKTQTSRTNGRSNDGLVFMADDESLEDQVPYKLEPSVSDIEEYLLQIRSRGL